MEVIMKWLVTTRPPTSKITALGTLVHIDPFTDDAYRDECLEDDGLIGHESTKNLIHVIFYK